MPAFKWNFYFIVLVRVRHLLSSLPRSLKDKPNIREAKLIFFWVYHQYYGWSDFLQSSSLTSNTYAKMEKKVRPKVAVINK